MAPRIGFIGLGNIGRPMATRLARHGFAPLVFDTLPAAVTAVVAEGARAATGVEEVGAGSEWIGVCVRDDNDVRAVLLGEAGLLASCSRDTIVVLHSTILPRTVREMSEAAVGRGVIVLDAPITGGAAGAAQGTLTIMVGGGAGDIERSRPAFEAMATRVIATGPVGSGAATKLCNNLMTYAGFLAAFEARLLACGAGLSEEALVEVTRSNGNLTSQMESFLHLHRVPEEQRAADDFQALLRNFTTLAEKDLALTLEFAREHGIALPGAGLCQQLMARVYGLDDPKRR